MRIMAEHVRRVAEYATELSRGAFRGADISAAQPGQSRRYADRTRDYVWRGEMGARQACAYYLGVIEAYNAHRGGTIADLPADLAPIRAELIVADGHRYVHASIGRGHADANETIFRRKT